MRGSSNQKLSTRPALSLYAHVEPPLRLPLVLDGAVLSVNPALEEVGAALRRRPDDGLRGRPPSKD
jgi:hypothetical protein